MTMSKVLRPFIAAVSCTILCGCAEDASAPHVHEIAVRGRAGRSIGISSDGKTIAVAANDFGAQKQRVVQILDATSREALGDTSSRNNIAQDILCVSFHPNGQLVAAGCRDGTVRIWNAKRLEDSPRVLQHPQAVWGVAFDPDGQWLATVAQDRCCRKWRLEDLKQIAQDCPDSSSSHSVVVSENGKFLVWGGDHSIRVLNCNDFSLAAEFPEKRWATSDDVAPQRKKRVPIQSSLFVAGIAISPQGDTVAYTLPSRGIVIRKGQGWKDDVRVEHDTPATCLSFTRDGERLLVGTTGSGVVDFDASTGRKRGFLELGKRADAVNGISVASRSDTIAVLIDGHVEVVELKRAVGTVR